MSERSGDREVLAELARRVEAGEAVVLATAVRTDGAPPCEVGSKLLAGPDGPLAGTLGCAEFDAQAVEEAAVRLTEGGPALRTFHHDLGRVDVYLEPHRQRPRLAVLGATPVATFLLRWAPDLGYDTVLVEGRADRVTDEQRRLAGAVVPGAAEAGLGPGAAAVATDHDAPGLADDLAVLLGAGLRFVGVMGSARHTAPHLAALRERGVGEEVLGGLRTPVGLDLGGRATPEIALAILAGLVADRHDRSGGWLA